MITMIEVLLAVMVGIALSIPFIIGIVYQTARNDRQLTFRNTGEIKFKKFGGMIVGLIMDIPGKSHRWSDDIIVDRPSGGLSPAIGVEKWFNRLERWFQERFASKFEEFKKNRAGIAYVSLFYPIGRLEEWEFAWPKLVPVTGAETAEGEGKLLEKYSIAQKTAPVKSLFYKFIYPAMAQNIELEGNFTISVLFQVTFTVVKPVYLIGNLKGKFMSQAMSEAIGILDSGLRGYSIEKWRAADRFKLVHDLLVGNGNTVLSGAIQITEATYIDFDYTGNSPKVIEAITINQVRAEEARAAVTEAKGKADAAEQKGREIITLADAEAKATVTTATARKQALELEGQGQASRLKSVIGELKSYTHGAEIYLAEQGADAIKGFTATGTLVTGKSGEPLVTVPAGGRK